MIIAASYRRRLKPVAATAEDLEAAERRGHASLMATLAQNEIAEAEKAGRQRAFREHEAARLKGVQVKPVKPGQRKVAPGPATKRAVGKPAPTKASRKPEASKPKLAPRKPTDPIVRLLGRKLTERELKLAADSKLPALSLAAIIAIRRAGGDAADAVRWARKMAQP